MTYIVFTVMDLAIGWNVNGSRGPVAGSRLIGQLAAGDGIGWPWAGGAPRQQRPALYPLLVLDLLPFGRTSDSLGNCHCVD
jgi:hypothetical protein